MWPSWTGRLAFGSNEERIRTRLGDEGVVVTFEQAAGQSLRPRVGNRPNLHPATTCPGGWTPQDAVAPTATGGGFEFSVGEARFRYDKLGLRGV